MQKFDPTRYTPEVARLLALDGNGARLMPLTCGACSSTEAHQILKSAVPKELFPGSRIPKAATAGLWLYFSCFEEAHAIVSKLETREAALWHAIMHRQEPDSGNAAYWFRKVGEHPTFSKISQAAIGILERIPQAEFRT